MKARDLKLQELMLAEVSAHLAALQASSGEPKHGEAVRRSLHALKGAAGLAGESVFADALGRLERRAVTAPLEVSPSTLRLLETARARLVQGLPAAADTFPVPPVDMQPSAVQAPEHYLAEMTDRLARIDEVLEREGSAAERLGELYRHIHSIKGASSAVGDDLVTWFCHGLEDRLRVTSIGAGGPERVIDTVREVRALLAGFLYEPRTTLESLRQSIATDPTRDAVEEQTARGGSIRVDAGSIDDVLERLVAIGPVSAHLQGRIHSMRVVSATLRSLHAELSDSLRLIGPPRLWGTPHAAIRKVEHAASGIEAIASNIETQVRNAQRDERTLASTAADIKQRLSLMRQTKLRELFQRLRVSIEAEALRSQRQVRVLVSGGDELVDRKIVEALFEPCLQIARNAVAHGIESQSDRERSGKPRTATVTLKAKRASGSLLISIEDDGRGVDMGALRKKAHERGLAETSVIDKATGDTLLSLLFLPGLSLRDRADALSGRGVGLDVTYSAIRRLGGAVRLSSKQGVGFAARIQVPLDTGFARMVCVRAGQGLYVISAQALHRVRLAGAAALPPYERVVHLAECIEKSSKGSGRLKVDVNVSLDPDEPEFFTLAVDELSAAEEMVVRPLPATCTGFGPFLGAVARADGTLTLALDVMQIAVAARALGAESHQTRHEG